MPIVVTEPRGLLTPVDIVENPKGVHARVHNALDSLHNVYLRLWNAAQERIPRVLPDSVAVYQTIAHTLLLVLMYLLGAIYYITVPVVHFTNTFIADCRSGRVWCLTPPNYFVDRHRRALVTKGFHVGGSAARGMLVDDASLRHDTLFPTKDE